MTEGKILKGDLKMRSISLFCLTIFLCLILANYDERSPVRSNSDLNSTPMENEEAELAALWLSGELVAPEYLYNKIRDDLDLIRSTWQDSVSEVEIIFNPYWQSSYLSFGFYQNTYDSILSGDYHAWDSLNEVYHVNNMSFIDEITHVSLHFEGKLNPIVLVDIYAGLPGTRYIHSGATVGDYPMLLIFNARGKLKYFFRNAWGDCPAGCIYSTYNYFEVVDDSAIHRGAWYPETPEDYDNAPIWFDTVLMARDNYFQYNSWHPSVKI